MILKNKKYLILIACLLIMMAILYKPQITLSSNNDKLIATIFKVGKADAIVIENND